MPTYRNDGQAAYRVENSIGQRVRVAPDGTVEMWADPGIPSAFTKTLDLPTNEVTGSLQREGWEWTCEVQPASSGSISYEEGTVPQRIDASSVCFTSPMKPSKAKTLGIEVETVFVLSEDPRSIGNPDHITNPWNYRHDWGGVLVLQESGDGGLTWATIRAFNFNHTETLSGLNPAALYRLGFDLGNPSFMYGDITSMEFSIRMTKG